jgi:hypothetical protein
MSRTAAVCGLGLYLLRSTLGGNPCAHVYQRNPGSISIS